MTTYQQCLRFGRKPKPYYSKNSHLEHNPQIRGVVDHLRIMAPKKPNSAKRKVAKLALRTGREVVAHIPGSGHNLQKHSDVLIRFGRRRDLPGVHYWIIRGKLDCTITQKFERHNRRSKFGLKRKLRPIEEAPRVVTVEEEMSLAEARFDMAARMLRNKVFAEKKRITFSGFTDLDNEPLFEDEQGIINDNDVEEWSKMRSAGVVNPATIIMERKAAEKGQKDAQPVSTNAQAEIVTDNDEK